MKSFRKPSAILALVFLALFGFQGTSWATAIAAANVTVTTNPQDMERVGRVKMNISTVAFGNAALTYPANGVPLPAKSKFGVDSIKFMQISGPPATGYVYKYDSTNHTIRIYQSAGATPSGTVAAPVFTGAALGTHVHDMLFIGGITATEPVVIDGGDILGKNAATNRSVLGADSATKGGVVAITGGTPAGTNSAPAFTGVAIAAGALVELGAVAVAATSLTVMTIGK